MDSSLQQMLMLLAGADLQQMMILLGVKDLQGILTRERGNRGVIWGLENPPEERGTERGKRCAIPGWNSTLATKPRAQEHRPRHRAEGERAIAATRLSTGRGISPVWG